VKITTNYTINLEVLQAFNAEVASQTRSRLIEALMIQFLAENTRGKK
jgi:hypothetical protein|tara:strand:+ start:4757 stop:4897 length:141 start_codon:yes stop_codon:yes gene_type:complete